MRFLPLALLALALPASALPRERELALAGVVDKFYDLDFDGARADADALAARLPGHPAGPFYRGVAAYQRWLAEGMRSTSTLADFEAQHALAQSAAEALMKEAPAEAHYYLGAVLGFRSRAAAGRRRFVRALPDGASAVRHLKKALALDPSLEDARLGLGMYHYFAARMPAGAKPFAYLMVGERGNREKGLQELWSVAATSGVARMEARSVLSVILSKDDEADWAAAERLLAELSARYPRNPLYRLRRAYVAVRRGAFDEAVSLADPDGKWLASVPASVRPQARSWALYRAAEARVLQGRAADAGAWLAELDKAPHPRALKDWVLLRQANRLDALGKEDEADALYKRIEDKRAGPVARRFLKDRYPGPTETAPFFTGY